MKRQIFFLISCIYVLCGYSQQQWQWAKSFTFNSGLFNPGTNRVASDVNNNNYVSINLNPSKACLLKTDSMGNELWRKFINGNMNVSQIAVSNAGVFMIGYFENTLVIESSTVVSSGMADVFFARFDVSGNLQWLKKMGGVLDDKGNGVAIDQSGSIYITGMFKDSALFEDQTLACECSSKLFIAKYNAQGSKLLLKAGSCMMDSTQGGSFSEGKEIDIDASGNILCTGLFSYFKMDTFQVWGGGGPYNSYFLTKLNPSGNTLWAKQVMIHSTPELGEMNLDNSGNILLTGYHVWTNGGTTMTQKIDPTGQILWTDNNTIGSCGYGSQGSSYSIVSDNSDCYIVGSVVSGYNNCAFSGWRLMMAKFNSVGTQIQYDTLFTNYVSNTNIIKSGGYYVITGIYNGPLTFGSTSINGNASTNELFMARFKASQGPTSLPARFTLNEGTDLYPNPSDGKFTINTKAGSMISVYDPFGKCVLFKTCKGEGSALDMSEMNKGVYFVEVISDNERTVRKIVIR